MGRTIEGRNFTGRGVLAHELRKSAGLVVTNFPTSLTEERAVPLGLLSWVNQMIVSPDEEHGDEKSSADDEQPDYGR